MTYFIIFILAILFLYIVRIIQINNSLQKQEKHIINLFNARTNMIPAVFEITKNFFVQHDKIFENILKYRKQELYKYYIQDKTNNTYSEFLRLIHLEELIHHEFNFIFRITNKHPKLLKKWNFIYIRELIINKSAEIWEELADYSTKIKLYNKLVFLKLFKKLDLEKKLF